MEIPLDVIHQILRPHSFDKKVNMRLWCKTALVAQSWREISQLHIFHELTLDFKTETIVEEIFSFFEERSHLAACVKWITFKAPELLVQDSRLQARLRVALPQISTIYAHHCEDIHQLYTLLASFPNVRTLLHAMQDTFHPSLRRPHHIFLQSGQFQPPTPIHLTYLGLYGVASACVSILFALRETNTCSALRRCEVTWCWQPVDNSSEVWFAKQLVELSNFIGLEYLMLDLSLDITAYIRSDPDKQQETGWYEGFPQISMPNLKEYRIRPHRSFFVPLVRRTLTKFVPALPSHCRLRIEIRMPTDVRQSFESEVYFDPFRHLPIVQGLGQSESRVPDGSSHSHEVTIGIICDLPVYLCQPARFKTLFASNHHVKVLRYKWRDYLLDMENFDDVHLM